MMGVDWTQSLVMEVQVTGPHSPAAGASLTNDCAGGMVACSLIREDQPDPKPFSLMVANQCPSLEDYW